MLLIGWKVPPQILAGNSNGELVASLSFSDTVHLLW